jgi:hypothetical protein
MSRRKSQGSRGVVKTAVILTLLPIPRPEASEQRTTVTQRHLRSGKEVAVTAAIAPAAAAAAVTSSKQMSFAQMSHAPDGKQWDTSPRYRQIDVEEGIAGNQKLPYQNEASTFSNQSSAKVSGCRGY